MTNVVTDDAPPGLPVAPADRVAVLGVRHHGPGSARSVVAELDRLQPHVVLIEGPADADPVIALAALEGMEPPVALLAYAPDRPQLSVFWPFAVFSPEWQALQWAARHRVPVRFCDLPSSAVLGRPDPPHDETPTGDEPLAEEVRRDPIALLAGAAGYDDPERWWDDVVESRLDGGSPFPAITEAMAEIRAATADTRVFDREREEQREAHMRQVLRAALKETTGVVAVVCGAWHAPALTGKLPPATADAKVLRAVGKRRTAMTWVPWTHSRLSAYSGYGAGVESPGWYHHLFTAPDRPVTRWLTSVAGVLRAHDLPVSSAHVIEAVRLAETLATLRGRPLAGLAEVTEGTRAVLCEGDEVALAFVTSDLVVGERLGAVPDGTPTVPLEADLRARAKTLRLAIDPLAKVVALDLRRDVDRQRSVLLHRLGALGIPWGAATVDQVRATGTFRETWTLQWQPELAVDIIDAAMWGTTVESAAVARLVDRAAIAPDLGTITGVVEAVLLGDLPTAMPQVLAALDAKAAVDLDVAHLMDAVPPLVRALRYGDVRDTDTSALAAVVDALVIRICSALPAAVSSLADDAAAEMRRRINAIHEALVLYAQDQAGREARDRWIAALVQLSGRRDVHGLVIGRVMRMLVDSEVVDRTEAARRLAAQLSIGVTATDKAAWVEGFLSGGGLLLVHDRALLAMLDAWVNTLAPDDFVDVLPLLRRTFGSFTAPERGNIANAVNRLSSGAGTTATPEADDVDAGRAAGVLRTVASILAGGR